MFEREIAQIRQFLEEIKNNKDNSKYFQSIEKCLDTIENTKSDEKENVADISANQSSTSQLQIEQLNEAQYYQETRPDKPDLPVIIDAV